MWSLVILAAGSSRRFGSNKIIAPVGPSGEWLLEYTIYDALLLGCSCVVIVTGSGLENLMVARLGWLHNRLPVQTVIQPVAAARKRPSGTAAAVLAGAARLSGRFVVVNGDDYYGRKTLARMVSWCEADKPSQQQAVAVYELAATVTDHRPVWRAFCPHDTEGRVSSVHEAQVLREQEKCIQVLPEGRREVSPHQPVSMNCWALHKDVYDEISREVAVFEQHNLHDGELTLAQALCSLMDQGRISLQAVPASDEWTGLTFPDDRYRVSQLLQRWVQEGLFPSPLWKDLRPVSLT
ncbi:MAG: NTP transferase domain-containing protein [Chitinophagales bacterium]|nr:NTP transferase domain-containing protein [Chitinophagales bacterium]MDW8393284.1 NTP transferase domain-containing protein [Chitinophagales bacterium]